MISLLFPAEGIQKQALSTEHRPVLIGNLGNLKCFLGCLEELHVGTPSLLEAEVDRGRRAEFQKILKCLHQQRECRLEVHTIRSQDGVGLVLEYLLGKRIAPRKRAASGSSLELISVLVSIV